MEADLMKCMAGWTLVLFGGGSVALLITLLVKELLYDCGAIVGKRNDS